MFFWKAAKQSTQFQKVSLTNIYIKQMLSTVCYMWVTGGYAMMLPTSAAHHNTKIQFQASTKSPAMYRLFIDSFLIDQSPLR